MVLSELSPGDKAVVARTFAGSAIGARLVEMGLVKGAKLKFIRKAPLGDPVEIQMRGFLLALRKAEAESVEVEVIGHAGDGKPMGQGRRHRHRKGQGNG